MGGWRGNTECGGNLGLGAAVGKQQEGGFLPGGECLEGGFEVEFEEELLLLLVGQGCLDLQLSGAEGFGSLLDFAQVEVTDTLAAQRWIPRWDPDRLALHHQKKRRPKSQRI